MNRLIFRAADVRRVVEHSLAAPKQARDVEAPAVLLVHDEGVYLMSNGSPRDIVSGERSYVAHAEGCNPKTDVGWYETARNLVGGDDFGEALPWAAQIAGQIVAGASQIIITITDDSLELLEPAAEK